MGADEAGSGDASLAPVLGVRAESLVVVGAGSDAALAAPV